MNSPSQVIPLSAYHGTLGSRSNGWTRDSWSSLVTACTAAHPPCSCNACHDSTATAPAPTSSSVPWMASVNTTALSPPAMVYAPAMSARIVIVPHIGKSG